MPSQKTDKGKTQLDEMWREHREYIKYLLVGLTRDIHLADDLIQETYLNAKAGMAGYAGGSARAWLSQIARRAYFTHRRRRYIRTEEPLEFNGEEPAGDDIGSLDHLMLIELRRAISELDSSVRSALIMKHYGGLTYKEISQHQSCPVGTAKWRVSTALDRLRTALAGLEEERARMECKELSGTLLADYAYRLLPPKRESAVRSHLKGCSACRKEVETIAKVAAALDAFEQENKSLVFYELDEQGKAIFYGFHPWRNDTDKPIDKVRFFDTGNGVQPGVVHVADSGEPIPFEVESVDSQRVTYAAKLSRPLQPGESRDGLVVHTAGQAQHLRSNNAWLFRPGLILKDAGEVEVRIEAVRLPSGAKLLSHDPQADDVYTNESTTLIWRRVMKDWETFALTVVYQSGQPSAESPSR